jgi:ATP-dependent protease HslVU (ClpYQ) peptidase subunit
VTVCIAALAADSQVIVCIADKALSFGDQIQWDADSSKITTLDNNKSLILMAGSEGPLSRLLRKLDPLTAEWSGDRNDLMGELEQRFKEAFSEEQEIAVLHRQGMTKEDYLKAVSGAEINRYMESVAIEVACTRFG